MRSQVADGYKSKGERTPYNGLYGEAPPEIGAFFRLQVYKRVGITQVQVFERVEKSVILVGKNPKRANRCVLRQ